MACSRVPHPSVFAPQTSPFPEVTSADTDASFVQISKTRGQFPVTFSFSSYEVSES